MTIVFNACIHVLQPTVTATQHNIIHPCIQVQVSTQAYTQIKWVDLAYTEHEHSVFVLSRLLTSTNTQSNGLQMLSVYYRLLHAHEGIKERRKK